jgi:AraC-like DNA-binding protein
VTRRLGNVSTKIWCADDLGPAELLRGRFSDYSYDVHSHDRACFALITRGAIRIRTRGTEFVARAGDLYAIDADEPHAGWPIDRDGWSLRTLYVGVGHLQSLIDADDAAAMPALAGPIIRDAHLTSLFVSIHASSETSGPPLARTEQYLSFVERLFARHTRSPPRGRPSGSEQQAIRLARDFLDNSLDRQVHLADIAAVAGLPRFQLFRAFSRTLGMSPHTYQRQARIRFAARLIKTGHSLSDAAQVAGFADQAHMTRHFRSTIGVTPGDYRQAYLDRGPRRSAANVSSWSRPAALASLSLSKQRSSTRSRRR